MRITALARLGPARCSGALLRLLSRSRPSAAVLPVAIRRCVDDAASDEEVRAGSSGFKVLGMESDGGQVTENDNAEVRPEWTVRLRARRD
jgi:hypothetical protein